MVSAARRRLGLAAPPAPGWDGAGALIAIVDSGIDTSHVSLQNAVIERVGPNHPNAVLDRNGHGTHVAAIAAGRHHPVGIAPGAALIDARYSPHRPDLSGLLSDIDEVATREGLPVVVNLSMGGFHHDLHDGSDHLSTAIDVFSGPGRIVCVAAGNEGTVPIHVTLQLLPGTGADLPISFRPGAAAGSGRYAYVRFHGGSLAADLICPADGASVTLPLGSDAAMGAAGGHQITLIRDSVAPAGGGAIMLSVAPRPGRSAPSWWILRLTADPNGSAAAIDGWGHDANVQFTGPMGDSAYVDPGNTIAGPASAASAITVGAVTSRDSWPDARGTPSNSAQLTLGEVCPFSNQGPTASGLERPDLVAPGAYVLSARASELASSFGQTQDPLLACALGTSQATPAVAGLIAIGLARKPQLGPQQVRQAIHAVATMPFGQGGVFDPAWGYGEVTAATLLPSL